MVSDKLKELYLKVKPAFSEELLAGLPENEIYDYKNFKLFPLELLVKADWNYKVEDAAQSKKLNENLKRNGQTETIHVRLLHTGYYEIVNGNHRYDEMAALGRQTVIAYDHGTITKEQAIQRCLETNERWFDSDSKQLGNLMKQLTDATDISNLLETMPHTEVEIKHLLKEHSDHSAGSIIEIAIPAKRQTNIKAGDVFQIGEHRLMCGDSLNASNMALLMNGKVADMVFTDVPYGIDYLGARSQVVKNKNYGKIKGDADKDITRFIKMCVDFPYKNDIYICVSPINLSPVFNIITDYNGVIVWKKNQPGLGYQFILRYCEFIVFLSKRKKAKKEESEFDYWEIPIANKADYEHGNQKPVALPARAIKYSSVEGNIIGDWFGGSGSTMLAAHQLKRNCYMMEIDPKACNVVLRRMKLAHNSIEIKCLNREIDLAFELEERKDTPEKDDKA